MAFWQLAGWSRESCTRDHPISRTLLRISGRVEMGLKTLLTDVGPKHAFRRHGLPNTRCDLLRRRLPFTFAVSVLARVQHLRILILCQKINDPFIQSPSTLYPSRLLATASSPYASICLFHSFSLHPLCDCIPTTHGRSAQRLVLPPPSDCHDAFPAKPLPVPAGPRRFRICKRVESAFEKGLGTTNTSLDPTNYDNARTRVILHVIVAKRLVARESSCC